MRMELDNIDSQIVLEALVTQLAVVQNKINDLKDKDEPISIFLVQRQKTLTRLIQVMGAEYGLMVEEDPS